MRDQCMQEKCQHNKNNPMLKGITKDLAMSLCPICDDCGSESNIVDDTCEACRKCENLPNYMRSGQPKPLVEIGQKQKDDVEIVRELMIEPKRDRL